MGRPQQAATAPAAEPASAPAPAAEQPVAPPAAAAARQPLPPPPADDQADAEAALLEADGDGPTSLAGTVPDDVAALVGDVGTQSNGRAGGKPVKELPPLGERQGGCRATRNNCGGGSLLPAQHARHMLGPVRTLP